MASIRPGQEIFVVESKPAVSLENIHMSYGKGSKRNIILAGITIQLPRGTIYGLLGPSGCGKTTLLRCVVGKLTPQQGSVELFGIEPGKRGSSVPGRGIGYMPQEIALYKEFSINDILLYYGRLYGLENNFMMERIKFLLKFLDLPDADRLIQNLSGGQQRRVSIAVALIHVPPLLILDEPTVGVDPLLRQKIWNYLVTLASVQKMTIIITTHYIEEARQATTIGLLRKGRLLANSDPDSLMRKHNLNTLEDVFLKLCLKDSKVKGDSYSEQIDVEMTDLEENSQRNGDIMQICNVQNNDNRNPKVNPNLLRYNNTMNNVQRATGSPPPPVVSPVYNGNITGSQKVVVIAKKNALKLKRNVLLLFIQILLPSIHTSLFCLCLNRQPFDLKFAIVDMESASGTIGYGDKFMKQLDKTVIAQVIYEDVDNAVKDIKKGMLWGAIFIGAKFTECFLDRVGDSILIDEEILTCSRIDVYIDMTKPSVTFTLFKSFVEAFKSFAMEALDEFGLDPSIVDPPLQLNPVYGSLEPSLKQCMLPAVVLGLIFTIAQAMTALVLVSEKKEGLVERDWIAGATEANIILGLGLVQFMLLLVQISLAHFVQLILFETKLEGSYFILWLLTLLQGTCGMTGGLAISTIAKNENSAIMLVLATFFTNFFLSGLVWPLESMPYLLRYFSYSTPQTFAIEAIISLFVRGWDFTNTIILAAFISTGLWTCNYLFLSKVGLQVKR